MCVYCVEEGFKVHLGLFTCSVGIYLHSAAGSAFKVEGVGMDFGAIRGNQWGVQFSVAKSGLFKRRK